MWYRLMLGAASSRATVLLLLLLTLPVCGLDARTALWPLHTPGVRANTHQLNYLADEMTFAAGVGRGHLHFGVDEFIHQSRSPWHFGPYSATEEGPRWRPSAVNPSVTFCIE